MLLSDDVALADRARFLSTQAREPVLHYEHRAVGYNYRMSNILAALGRAQLGRLDAMVAQRRRVRRRYAALVAEWEGVSVFQTAETTLDNCWLTALMLDPAARVSRDQLLEALDRLAIESRPLWKPMHLQPVFAGAHFFGGARAESLFERGVTLPSGSSLSDRELDRVCSALSSVLVGEAVA